MRMLIANTIVAASLLLAGASASAADANVHKAAKPTHAHAVVHAAARQRYPGYATAPYGYRTPYHTYYSYGAPYTQFGFGGWPFNGKPPHVAARGGRGSPSFDSGPSIDETSTSPDFSAGQAAIQAIVDSAGSASASAAQAISDAQQIINNSAN
jgi:hypothetical protein